MVVDDRLNYPYPIFYRHKPEDIIVNNSVPFQSYCEQVAGLNKEIQRLKSLMYVDLTNLFDKWLEIKEKEDRRAAAKFITLTIEEEKINGRWHNLDLMLLHYSKEDYHHEARGFHVGILMNTYHGQEYLKNRKVYLDKVKTLYKIEGIE